MSTTTITGGAGRPLNWSPPADLEVGYNSGSRISRTNPILEQFSCTNKIVFLGWESQKKLDESQVGFLYCTTVAMWIPKGTKVRERRKVYMRDLPGVSDVVMTADPDSTWYLINSVVGLRMPDMKSVCIEKHSLNSKRFSHIEFCFVAPETIVI